LMFDAGPKKLMFCIAHGQAEGRQLLAGLYRTCDNYRE